MEMSEEKRSGFSDGVRQGLGVLSAFKEAIEETLSEARERGDLNPERARSAMKSALHRAQEVAGDAKEKLDFVNRREFEALRDRVEELWRKVEGRGASPEDAGAAPGSSAGEGAVEG
jgi:polyhydroxyalkanoate synthesis regulator phasin